MAGIFLTGEKMVNEMICEIVSDQNLMKYIAYDEVSVDPSVLDEVINPARLVYSPERATPTDLRTYRIFNIPKTFFVEEDKKTIVSCYFLYTEPAGNNDPYYSNYYICFDVACHVDLWAIKGGIIRPLRICDAINDIFNLKYSDNSFRRLYPEKNTYINWDSKGIYCGYKLVYKATGKSDGCGVVK